jgi:hypothetical protein
MHQKVVITIQLLFSVSGLFFLTGPALANDNSPAVGLTRGRATEMIVQYFDLEERNRDFLATCREDYGSCTFAFSARSNFDQLRLDPLILYPDVYPAYRHYQAINVASLLDLASGYYMEEQSPFRPEQAITRVEALKLVMGAAGLLNWKEKFELSQQDQTWLKISLDTSRWWYGRYLAEAAKRGFVEQLSETEAEETISESELLGIMEAANRFVASR